MRFPKSSLTQAALLLAVTEFLSTFPFFPLRNAEALSDNLDGFFSLGIEPPIFMTVLERCVFLLPVGYLGARALRDRSAPVFLIILVFGAFFVALGLEASQIPFALRHARYSDALIAYWSLLSGAVIGLIHIRAPRSLARGAIFAGLAAISAFAGLGLAVGPSMGNWSCSYHALAGDEYGGGRPWRGAISGIALYPRTLDETAVRMLADRPFAPSEERARKALGAVWVYSGEDEAGAPKTPLELWKDGGAAATLPIAPEVLKTQFCDAVRRSSAVTIELHLRPDLAVQWGPARILTYSKSIALRNFTVGQLGDSYDFRIRAQASGSNGLQYPIRTAPGTVALRWQHVTATYGDGAASLYIDGRRAAGPVRFTRVFEIDPRKSASAFVLYLAFGSAAVALLWLDRRRLGTVFRRLLGR